MEQAKIAEQEHIKEDGGERNEEQKNHDAASVVI